MTRSARIERARAAHYQEPSPSRAEDDGGIDFARLKIEPRYLPALDADEPISERAAALLQSEARLAEASARCSDAEDALSAALATPEGRRVLQDDPCEPGGDPFWHELFGAPPEWDGAW